MISLNTMNSIPVAQKGGEHRSTRFPLKSQHRQVHLRNIVLSPTQLPSYFQTIIYHLII